LSSSFRKKRTTLIRRLSRRDRSAARKPGPHRPDSISAFVIAAWVSLGLSGCGAEPPADAPPPNIIFLVSDDQGFGDYGFMGHNFIQTPNLDRLAAEGVTFTQARNTASICQPSLTTLLTGIDPIRWRQDMLSRALRDPNFREAGAIRLFDTLPRRLATAGYASFQAGKLWDATFAQAGFSHGMTTIADSSTVERHSGGDGHRIGRETMQPLYDFITHHTPSARSDEARPPESPAQAPISDEPFFVFFAPKMPHLPHTAPRRHRALYEGMRLSPSAERYFAMCSWYDEVVGELVAFLDERGLRERTLLIHLADNGWEQRPFASTGHEANTGLGGATGKATLHELGFRTPIVFNWPGHVPAGKRVEELVSTLDLVPTALDYAGVDIPTHLVGHTLRRLVEEPAQAIRQYLVAGLELVRGSVVTKEGPTHIGRGYNLRSLDWSYQQFTDHRIERLYAIRDDPDERHDVSGQHPERLVRFRKAVETYRWQQIQPYYDRAVAEQSRDPARAGLEIECMKRDVPTGLCLMNMRAARKLGRGSE